MTQSQVRKYFPPHTQSMVMTGSRRSLLILATVKESIPSQICFTSDNWNDNSKLKYLTHINFSMSIYPAELLNRIPTRTVNSLSNLQSNSNAIILGDWQTHTAGTPFSRHLCNTLHQLNYMQLVSVPTHQTGNTLDLVLTNAPQRIENTCVKTNSPLMSDHYPVSLDISSTWGLLAQGQTL